MEKRIKNISDLVVDEWYKIRIDEFGRNVIGRYMGLQGQYLKFFQNTFMDRTFSLPKEWFSKVIVERMDENE